MHRYEHKNAINCMLPRLRAVYHHVTFAVDDPRVRSFVCNIISHSALLSPPTAVDQYKYNINLDE